MIAILSILLIFYMSKNNLITLLIAIEILLLMVTIKIIYIGNLYDDIYATIFGIVIILLAGAESAIGLSILVSYYKLRGKIVQSI
ncbi:NADH dehydrogenase subunit 4L (mitochondrion) [Candida oxycetoniae]|uniref:NADH-ubiquinone oxidoreductase chain 4L n=1 Tax=Candida oxycetoniae TaxID=497107 RepID=S5TEN3_9ASCO|nr:NADH dehydrogenase subunit 4L [Candida oxycetoniae]AGS44329.1 NADH dehydrogenase subunit 4L [Candida oxycetoniae]